MRIAQVAPLYESVPPKFYGGTERVVSYLTEELVQQGHDVTLFASGDSLTAAKLVAACPRALRLEGDRVRDPLAHHVQMLERVFRQVQDFDIVHFHVDYLHFPLTRRENINAVTTLHGRLDIRDLIPVYREFGDMNLVSISNAQRKPLDWANWLATVYHGLPEHFYTLQDRPGQYLAFLGRISPEKRLDRAIEIAKRVGMPLKIAAKVDAVDREYFESEIKALLDHPLVEYLGEIGEREKNEFLGNASALLFPIDWPEPFGLVMIEAMACGTPIIGYCLGSVPEIIENDRTGFLVNGIDEAAEAAQRIGSLDRKLCRRVFEKRFSAGRMCLDYVKIYEQLAAGRKTKAERILYGGGYQPQPSSPSTIQRQQ